MNYKIVTCPEKHFSGNTIRTTNQDGKGLKAIGDAWTSFFTLNPEITSTPYGVYHNYESDFTGEYDFTPCLETTTLSPQTITAPAGSYALFQGTQGTPESVGELWKEIWNTDLPRAYCVDYEIYLPDGTLEVYIGLTE